MSVNSTAKSWLYIVKKLKDYQLSAKRDIMQPPLQLLYEIRQTFLCLDTFFYLCVSQVEKCVFCCCHICQIAIHDYERSKWKNYQHT